MSDALRLPFADNTFVCATAGFSLRNMADVPAAIAEMARIVSPGGRVTTLELTPMPPGIRAALGRLYFHHLVPFMGQVGRRRPHRLYLPAQQRGLFPHRRGSCRGVPQCGPGERGLPPARPGRRRAASRRETAITVMSRGGGKYQHTPTGYNPIQPSATYRKPTDHVSAEPGEVQHDHRQNPQVPTLPALPGST